MSDLAEEMQADALEAQRFSRKHLVLELDFSEATMEELEGQVDTVEYALRDGKSEENVAMLTRIWGAYLGESIRKTSGGEWIRDDQGLALQTATGLVRPQEQVRLRIMEGDQHNLVEFYRKSVG